MSGGRVKLRNSWVLLLFLLAGIVIGGLMGEYLGTLPYLEWLNYSKSFGFSTPFILDLEIIKLTFGFTLKFSISGIIGMLISFFVYRKLIK